MLHSDLKHVSIQHTLASFAFFPSLLLPLPLVLLPHLILFPIVFLPHPLLILFPIVFLPHPLHILFHIAFLPHPLLILFPIAFLPHPLLILFHIAFLPHPLLLSFSLTLSSSSFLSSFLISPSLLSSSTPFPLSQLFPLSASVPSFSFSFPMTPLVFSPPLCSLSFPPFLPFTWAFIPSTFFLSFTPLFPFFSTFSPNLCTRFSHSPILLSLSLLHTPISSSFSPPSLFANSISFNTPELFFLPPFPFNACSTHKTYLLQFTFSLSSPKLSPLIHCLHFSHSTKNSSPLPTIPTIPSTHFSLTHNWNSTKTINFRSTLLPLYPAFVFPPKNAAHATPIHPQNLSKLPNYSLPTSTKHAKINTHYSYTKHHNRHTANPVICFVIFQNSSPLSSASPIQDVPT